MNDSSKCLVLSAITFTLCFILVFMCLAILCNISQMNQPMHQCRCCKNIQEHTSIEVKNEQYEKQNNPYIYTPVITDLGW